MQTGLLAALSFPGERKAIVIVISPLIALMKDQTSKFKDKALSAGFVSDGSSLEMKLGVLSGTF